MSMEHKKLSYTVIWSDEDQEFVGLCAEFPSLSWLAASRDEALTGIKNIVADILADLWKNSESHSKAAKESLYLLSNPVNAAHLQKSINDLENNRGISVSLNDL